MNEYYKHEELTGDAAEGARGGGAVRRLAAAGSGHSPGTEANVVGHQGLRDLLEGQQTPAGRRRELAVSRDQHWRQH